MMKNLFFILIVSFLFLPVCAEEYKVNKKQQEKNMAFMKKCYTDRNINTGEDVKKYLKEKYLYDVDKKYNKDNYNKDTEIIYLKEKKQIIEKYINDTCFIEYIHNGVRGNLEMRFVHASQLDFLDLESDVRKGGENHIGGLEIVIEEEEWRLKKLKAMDSL